MVTTTPPLSWPRLGAQESLRGAFKGPQEGPNWVLGCGFRRPQEEDPVFPNRLILRGYTKTKAVDGRERVEGKVDLYCSKVHNSKHSSSTVQEVEEHYKDDEFKNEFEKGRTAVIQIVQDTVDSDSGK